MHALVVEARSVVEDSSSDPGARCQSARTNDSVQRALRIIRLEHHSPSTWNALQSLTKISKRI